MQPLFPRALALAALSFFLASCAPVPSQAQNSKWNRVLLVGGGPDAANNQYAIESNARYVASLTKTAKWRRILFADGKTASRTISTLVDSPQSRARAIVSWIWELDAPTEQTVLRAPTLSPINGAATPSSIAKHIAELSVPASDTDFSLLYFTGHGSAGSFDDGREDYQNTVYNGWSGDFSTRDLARAVQKSTSQAPLVLVMVQCHGGGFANALFQSGDPKQTLWTRDFCGFFAATGERMSAGCTSQVNERDYQDFTTHFFAALSGRSRDGRAVSGADYDQSGSVSLLEAYAYANINDDSIDVPVCTSDAFLRHVYGNVAARQLSQTPYSQLTQSAAPWQRAVLTGLSSRLKLSGETRVALAQKRLAGVSRQNANSSDDGEWTAPSGINRTQFNAAYSRLENLLERRFPLAARGNQTAKTRAFATATSVVAAQKRDLDIVYRAYTLSSSAQGEREVEEAQLLRFLRLARTIELQNRLAREGTPDQKATFARLRQSESRSAF